MTIDKITARHLQKTAYVYLRQSSIGQVRHHRESTERQYALQETARSLGWPLNRITVLDGDLGKSGTSTTDREDFKTLVADVSLGKAGAVLAVDASRLARSNADWHRLIEICGITGTLIIDEDGCYDPCDFNDGLLFAQCGSSYGVVQRFSQEKLLFPKRSYGGAWDGKLHWGRLTDSRVLAILKNPSYAGVYAFGRFRSIKEILADGALRSRISQMPRDQWLVEIRDHHEGYTSFEEHLKNLETLERNRTNQSETILSGPAREGLALLQGLLICGCCGRRMTPRYRGNGGIYPIYECNWRKREGLSKTSCLTVQCGGLDGAVQKRVLQVVDEEHINLALEAYEIVQQRHHQIDSQWQMRLERARYETQLAQRRYDEVDPSNRLVASTLEQRWNDALIELEDVEQQVADLQKRTQAVTSDQRAQVLSLAQDLPRLWTSTSTSWKDKKRFLQLLIADITVEKPEPARAILHLRWQGGVCEDLAVELPRPTAERWRHDDALVQRVGELAREYSDVEIATQLNADGKRSNKGNAFTRASVSWIRHKHGIAAVDKKQPGECTVKEVAQQFGVSTGVVYYWIDRKILSARRLNQGSPYWIAINSEKQQELETWVRESNRIESP